MPGVSGGSYVEREAKLVAPPGLAIPDLNGLVPGATVRVLPVERLDATYYDTSDLRLARSGITVRHRGGESGPPWTVKLPEDDRGSDLVRREIRFEGPPDRVPNAAADLVLASSRALALQPVASLTTVRRPVEIRGVDGELLAEVVDDTVSVSHNQNPTGWFREVEVELHVAGGEGDRVLGAAVSRLVGAGCDAEPPLPKLVRALGEPATRPPDVIIPPMPPKATVVDLVRQATARAVDQIVRHDPGARMGDDPEDVHKLRVATRRLRSDLHSFAAVLDPARTRTIRSELGWLGGVVGAVRDTDVLSARLATRLAELPDDEVESVGARRLQTLLARQSADARTAMLIALRDARYLHLLDILVDLTVAPPFRKAAGKAHPADIAADGVDDRPEAVAAGGRRHRVAGPVPLRHPTPCRCGYWPSAPATPPKRLPPCYARPPRASPQPWRTSKPFWGTIRTPSWPKPGCATRPSVTPRRTRRSDSSSPWNRNDAALSAPNGPPYGVRPTPRSSTPGSEQAQWGATLPLIR